ncbi:MAG TPA: thioredoxin domain-containing protein [Thermoanaerobaculia bacterium]|nr:thioredoxin domain-containing protein [Thermoanaerobaculia bacterium]
MAKGRRPVEPQSTPWMRWGGVLVGLAIAGAIVWWVARPSGAETAGGEAGATARDEAGRLAPQPLDLSSGPSVEAAARLDAPAESLASAGPDAPSGIDISNDPRLGDSDAPVTIVEFSDFQCPHCADFHRSTFPALRTLYGDRVRWVFVNRFFAAAHPMAERAAIAAECANRQGGFWDYADLVFRNQAQLSPGMLVDTAEMVGLDMDAFRACVESGDTASEVAADQAEADRLGVDGTPTFFINGRKIVGAQPPAVFNQLIGPYFAQ